jgi:hypothetical protein
MPAINKDDTRFRLQFVANSDHSIQAGLVAVEAMARRFGLWEKLRKIASLDPRKDQRRGYGPEVIAGQLIYALCSGGGGLSDSEASNDDPLARKLFGVKKFADQTQVGEWLREQSEESVAALRRLLREFAAWVWEQAQPGRLLHAGLREVFSMIRNWRFWAASLRVMARLFDRRIDHRAAGGYRRRAAPLASPPPHSQSHYPPRPPPRHPPPPESPPASALTLVCRWVPD